jgi:hypothetical protein
MLPSGVTCKHPPSLTALKPWRRAVLRVPTCRKGAPQNSRTPCLAAHISARITRRNNPRARRRLDSPRTNTSSNSSCISGPRTCVSDLLIMKVFKSTEINTSKNSQNLSTALNLKDLKPTRINTSGNKDLKPRRINTSGSKDLKSCRINTSKKQGRGGVESRRTRLSEAKFPGRRAFVASISARPKLLLVPPHIKWVGGNTP